MSSSNRFAVAIHVLALARGGPGEPGRCPVTSEYLAELVNTNPVVIRRILGPLREAGLVSSQPGPGGGWRLTRPAAEITLRDVYRAIEGDRPFPAPARTAASDCPIGRCLSGVLATSFRAAEQTLEAQLAKVTVADVIRGARGFPSHVVSFDDAAVRKEVAIPARQSG